MDLRNSRDQLSGENRPQKLGLGLDLLRLEQQSTIENRVSLGDTSNLANNQDNLQSTQSMNSNNNGAAGGASNPVAYSHTTELLNCLGDLLASPRTNLKAHQIIVESLVTTTTTATTPPPPTTTTSNNKSNSTFSEANNNFQISETIVNLMTSYSIKPNQLANILMSNVGGVVLNETTQETTNTTTTQSMPSQTITIQSSTQTTNTFNRLDLLKLSDLLPATESSYALEALDTQWQRYFMILYSLTAFASFILNVVTVIVLARCQRSELRKYLINLSLSDLLMSLLSIPFTYTEYMLGHWIFAAFLCPVVRFVVTLSVFVSVATMTVIGINRHLAIMYPLKRKKYSNIRHWSIRKTHVIVGIWVLGVAMSLPEFLMFRAEPFCHNRQLLFECRQTWPVSVSNTYTVFIYLSTFLIPLILLTYLYTRIGIKIWHNRMPGNEDKSRDETIQKKRTKVVKMLLVVVVLFAVFWLPLQTLSMVLFLYPEIRQHFEYQSSAYNIIIGTYFVCHWMSMAHSCLNPLIYCFMNEKFRSDLWNLFCGLRGVASMSSASLSTNVSISMSGHANRNRLRKLDTTCCYLSSQQSSSSSNVNRRQTICANNYSLKSLSSSSSSLRYKQQTKSGRNNTVVPKLCAHIHLPLVDHCHENALSNSTKSTKIAIKNEPIKLLASGNNDNENDDDDDEDEDESTTTAKQSSRHTTLVEPKQQESDDNETNNNKFGVVQFEHDKTNLAHTKCVRVNHTRVLNGHHIADV